MKTMKRAAAKKQALFRSALAVLALLLLASPTFATRTNPAVANDLGTQRGAALLIDRVTADDLAAALKSETQIRFPLFANKNQLDSVYKRTVVPAFADTFRLSADLEIPPRIITGQKLASGGLAWEPRLNLRRIIEIVAISPWRAAAYARNRWYDPRNATWLSEDPIGARDSVNLYAFVGLKPWMARDPMGLGEDDDFYPCSGRSQFTCGAVNEARRANDARMLAQREAAGWGYVFSEFFSELGGKTPGLNNWREAADRARRAGKEFWRFDPKVTQEMKDLGLDYGAEAERRLGSVMGDITGVGLAFTVEQIQTIVELEVGGKVVRAVIGAGGRVIGIVGEISEEGITVRAATTEQKLALDKAGFGPKHFARAEIGSTRHVKLEKATNGSYTIEFESGKGYAGKGGTTRSRRSARQRSRENLDPVKSIDHTVAETEEEAFRQEAARLEKLGGPGSPQNYNKINSPGKKINEDH